MHSLKMELLRIFYFSILNSLPCIFEHRPDAIFQTISFFFERPVLVVFIQTVLVQINLFISQPRIFDSVMGEARVIECSDWRSENKVEDVSVKHDK